MKRIAFILLQSLFILCILSSLAFADLVSGPRVHHHDDDDDDACTALVLRESAPIGAAAFLLLTLAVAGIASRRRSE